MIQVGRREIGIHGFALRLLGIATMAASVAGSHLGYRYEWLEAFGWTSFTLFAFLLSEGVAHSSDKTLYVRRFLLFGIIGELVYDFYKTGRFFSFSNTFLSMRQQSAMVSLFTGLIVLLILTYVKKRYDNLVVDIILIAVLGYAACRLAEAYNFQFGRYGIIIILMFYVARNVTYSRTIEVIVLFYVCFFVTSDVLRIISLGGVQYPLSPQLYSFIALPFIWAYDDTRGPNSIALQVAQYLAYPLVYLVFILLRYI